ncbi:MAG TPA: NADH-quinone oxidoreductase subunit C [Egibacteraceae bacterium]|nr:NADH-quinone oxidoreductase subunit C [Egibacteraceae bacterium]
MSSTREVATRTGARAAEAFQGGSPMEPEALAAHLCERLGRAVVDVTVTYGQLTLTVEADALAEAARLCKESPALAFDFYDHNAGVDLGEEGFAVVTHLYSLRHRHHIMIRVVAPGGRQAPKVPTLTHLYAGADWHEREVYDMFGIDFEGHPGLLPRLLTVENFEGFPLRKDFLLATREAKPWPGLKEPKEIGSDEEEAADATAAEAPVAAEEKAQAAKTRAERARAKAAAMRAEKQSEKAAAQAASTEEAEDAGSAPAGEAEDAQAAAAEKTTGGETAGAGAAQVAAAAGEPEPQTPGGAADVARTDIAKDAAAGAVGGDTAAGAPGDRPGTDQPVHDPESEAKVGEGAPPVPSGAPGPEAEGRHGGAEREGRSASDAAAGGPKADAGGPTASPYADRSHASAGEGASEASETLDEVGRPEDPRPADTPDDDTRRGGDDS